MPPKKSLYTDKEYLDLKFSDLADQLIGIHAEILALKQTLHGNGKKGLIEKVKEAETTIFWSVRAQLVLIVFILVTHAQESVTFLTELLKKKI